LDKDLLVEWRVEPEQFMAGSREEEGQANPDGGTAVFTVRAVLGHMVIPVYSFWLHIDKCS
jgi:hypothetical protein